jgi:phenylpropionate dioxygenase-like ring-hydroxylating dioxygenase large terminal subunit
MTSYISTPLTERSAEDGDGITLANFWHPVALAAEVKEQPRQFELLGELIALFRDGQGVAAFKDLCIHRGAALSLGWIEDGRLTCIYHGWQYDRSGACVHIPSLPPGSSIPRKARATAYRAAEAYGMVWVAMEEPVQPIPPWPEYTVGGDHTHLFALGRYVWKTSAGRAAENGLDFSHFNHAHKGYLDLADGPVIKPHKVQESEFRLDYTYEDGDSRREYIVHSPFTVFIRKTSSPHRTGSSQTWDRDSTPPGGTTVLAQFASPIDETRTSVFALVGRNHSFEMSDREFAGGSWFDDVLEQDRRVVESQRPERIPTDLREELHLKVPDATGIAYRRMLSRIASISRFMP